MAYRVEVQWTSGTWTDISNDVVDFNISEGTRADNIRPGVRVASADGGLNLYDDAGDYHRSDTYRGRFPCRITYIDDTDSSNELIVFDGFIGGRSPGDIRIGSTASFVLDDKLYNVWNENPKVTSASSIRNLVSQIISEYDITYWMSDFDDLPTTALENTNAQSLQNQLSDLSLLGGYFIGLRADNKLVIRSLGDTTAPSQHIGASDDVLTLREWTIPAVENIRIFREGNRGRDQLNVDSGDYRAIVSSTNANDTLTLVHFFNAPFQVEFPEAVSATLMSFTAETWVNAGPGTDAVLTSVDLLNYSGITSWIDVYTIPVSGGIGFLASDGAEWPNGDFKYRMRFRFDTDEARDVFNDHIWTFRWQISVVYDYGRVDIISGSSQDLNPSSLPANWIGEQAVADTLAITARNIYNVDKVGLTFTLPMSWKNANLRIGDLVSFTLNTNFGTFSQNLMITGTEITRPPIRTDEPKKTFFTISLPMSTAVGAFTWDRSLWDSGDRWG